MRAARAHLAADADAPTRGAGWPASACGLRVDVGIEDDLGEALAVAQVDEDRAAVVAAVLHPAEQDDLFPTSRAVSSPQVWVRLTSVMNGTAMEGAEPSAPRVAPLRVMTLPGRVKAGGWAQDPVGDRTADSAARKSRILRETRVRPFQVSSEGW